MLTKENENKIIEYLFNTIDVDKVKLIKLADVRNIAEITDNEFLELILYPLINAELISPIENKFPAIKLLKKGHEIKLNGGWIKYYDQELKNIEIQKRKQIDELEKLHWDKQVSRFQAKTKFWPLIISFISLIIAGFSIYMNIKKNKTKESKTNKTEILMPTQSNNFSDTTIILKKTVNKE
jgi:hypothetical protein